MPQNTKNPLLLLQSSLPHQDAAIAAAAAEGARMVSPQMTPPRLESSRRRAATPILIMLCIVGSILTASICFWTAVGNSTQTPLKRTLISSIAAFCTLLFLLIAIRQFKRSRRKPVDDIEISQSILREHRKSMTNSLRKSTAQSNEFIQQIRRHSSVIAVDAARQKLLSQQPIIIKSAGGNLLSVESPLPKRATSTSN